MPQAKHETRTAIRPLEAVRPGLENMRAIRLALDLALLEKPCACGRPAWRVVSTQGRTRYVRCDCGRTGKIVTEKAL